MKQDIRRKATVSNITGCLLFLQVFYLDNIQLGDLSMTHDVFPRIKAFTADKIRAMINADKRPMDSSKNGDFIYGIPAPRDADSSAYSRADDEDNAQQGGDAWACATKICDAMGLTHQAKLNLYNELTAHQEGIIKQVQVMNAKFYGKIYKMLNDNSFTRNKGVMHASGLTIVSRNNNATKSSTVEADMASDDVSSPEKRNDEAFVLHMQNKRPRVDIDATSNAVASQHGGGLRSNSEMDVDLNVADLLASTPEGNTMDVRKHVNTVRWDNEPSFDLGLDFTPSPKVGKNKSVSCRYQDGGYALFGNISDGDAADINNGSQGVTSSCKSWRNDGIAGGSSDGQGPNQSSHTPSACPSDNLGTPASSVADSVPPYWYLSEQTRSSSPTSVDKIIQDYFVYEKDTRFTDIINLNAKTLDFDVSNSPVVKRRTVSHTNHVVGPCITTLANHEKKVIDDFFCFVASMEESHAEKCVWIMHHTPSYIEVTADQLKSSFCGKVDVDHDIFSLMIRRPKQIDHGAAQGGDMTRIKHYMEADLMMRVMAGDMPCQHKSIRDQFIGDHITYDVPNCMLIMFPAYVSFAWVCYAIHTIKKKVFIYDPTLASENGGAIKQLHMRNCNLLKSAMTEFAKTYFESWDFRFGDLEPAIIHPKRQVSERHLSGFYTMNFCRNFIGDQETDNIHVDDDSSLAAYYLYDILHLKGNNAKRPHQFIESIDE
ncbi:hypothetical protein CFC21_107579 [Triticum aestivum]|uniref:Uncharacterized protein n=3 Tax=Triticum aestivum TaxID=4565 RepID=A0A3B6TK19_WHEAT|nr:hypothetical protein CFC21_107579 [Triticum aestivum]